MKEQAKKFDFVLLFQISIALIGISALIAWAIFTAITDSATQQQLPPYKPRIAMDTSGLNATLDFLKPWPSNASLEEIGDVWRHMGYRNIEQIDRKLTTQNYSMGFEINCYVTKALLYGYEGDSITAYKHLKQARTRVESNDAIARESLYSIIYLQGVIALRRGEDENCILCRGESSCILPIAPAAVHAHPEGSRLAIKHFTEYLNQFPDDLEVRWLLNLAHMTLGQHPEGVNPEYLISLDQFRKSEFDIGKFRDIGHVAGVNRLNQSGGGIMEDFDNDGLLDIATTSFDPTQSMAIYRNKGDGTFEDRTSAAGVSKQSGGLYCVQTDYNNDGFIDIYIPRGAWYAIPKRPTLLRNNGHFTFTDVTREAGLLDPVDSISASWADYDNDGFLDLFVCCDTPPNRLYRNNGNGAFTEVAAKAGLRRLENACKGAAWIDFDNDDYPDLFLSYFTGESKLFRNNRNGFFIDVTRGIGIKGPKHGFSCWAWDHDNDGWLDIFATSYDGNLEDAVKGLINRPHGAQHSRLYRNLNGKGFADLTKIAGLDKVYSTMGSNYGDFDNDGYLDMYLGTGFPSFHFLVPNRMFKNVAGKRFADITVSSRTGNLQKGHGVACGDWDRDGNVDIFIEMGGAVDGDKYHNILFQNPGQGNNWLTLKLIGKKTNRAAIGARIKVVTAGEKPLTVYRHVSSGSSFGANPLQQTIGLAKAKKIATLEIHWPTSATTQVFRDVEVNQALEITEFAKDYRRLNWTPIRLKES